jgi:hypothetical protein
MTILFISVLLIVNSFHFEFHSGLRQSPRLTTKFEMFKLTIFILVGHQRTILHVVILVKVGGHTDVHIATKSALLHKKIA